MYYLIDTGEVYFGRLTFYVSFLLFIYLYYYFMNNLSREFFDKLANFILGEDGNSVFL